jgi:hypothetical protein
VQQRWPKVDSAAASRLLCVAGEEICKSAIFFLGIVPGRMRTDELSREPDLEDISDQAHLHLLERKGIARPVVGAREAQVAPAVHLADDRRTYGPGAPPRPPRSHSVQ